ncbi:unnamed protein product [Rotaria magnacalcarata]|uniref:DUF7789 domain-containing protein n=3 Tax=Rotaria magnacalcarata TaxID=392030 RepID=A0A8S2L3K3_9BILA|nr:unnamed protein product [Rotaria magnacalcarata]
MQTDSVATPLIANNVDINSPSFARYQRRRWIEIKKSERIFFVIAIIAVISTIVLTIISLFITPYRHAGFAYTIIIIITSALLVSFLFTGIFYHRFTDYMAILVGTLMLGIYVFVHYHLHRGEPNGFYRNFLIARLALAIIFFTTLLVIGAIELRAYYKDKLTSKQFRYHPQYLHLRLYNIFGCSIRVNTLFLMSLFLLNLYNFNQFESIDTTLLTIGIPSVLFWLAIGIVMVVRVENNKLTWAFFLLSSLQPAFMIYCLFSALKYSPAAPLTTAATTTATAAATTAATATTTTIIILQFTISTILKPLSKSLISILPALYTCVAVNFVSFILSIVFAIKCIRNFDKGLKERVFHSKLDQWLQGKLSNNVSTL